VAQGFSPAIRDVVSVLLRDKLLARMADMAAAPDYQRLAAEVLGIRNAPPELARRLVSQALVVEDRREAWARVGERICRDAPATPGVYVLKDADDRPIYVGKAVNVRRRLRAHFAGRRWRALTAEMTRVAAAEWIEVGSELEALLREASLIHDLQPTVNVQVGAPQLDTRDVPRSIIRDVLVVLPSAEADSVELVGARVDGPWMIQRTRRSGADLAVHAQRVLRFFRSVLPRRGRPSPPLAPIVFSWLTRQGSGATRLDPRDLKNARDLRTRLAALFRDERLFHERLEQRAGTEP
jgi:predicted GIY-YIG superfamily endonuclease